MDSKRVLIIAALLLVVGLSLMLSSDIFAKEDWITGHTTGDTGTPPKDPPPIPPVPDWTVSLGGDNTGGFATA